MFVAQVGKTSLILSLVSEEFPDEVSSFKKNTSYDVDLKACKIYNFMSYETEK